MAPMALFKLVGLRAARKNIRAAVKLAHAVWAPFASPTPRGSKAGAPPQLPAAAKASAKTRGAGGFAGPSTAGFHEARFLYRRADHGYKIYLPPLAAGEAFAGLVVMLHGCQQTPDDFATGTRMNEHARAARCMVVYPRQPASAHRQRCWNWFDPASQVRGTGEPAWIAALARGIAKRWGLRRQQVFIAGLSAGGAMAATVAHAYPDVFGACGVHSGLAAGAARGTVGAMSAMRHGSSIGQPPPARQVPTIAFHGDRDTTVNPRHGAHIIAAALRPSGAGRPVTGPWATPEVTEMHPADGHGYTRHVHRDGHGRPVAERWQVHGMGHAWSGGSARGSHADPAGPDASAAMLAFFLGVAAKRSPKPS